MVAPQPTPFPHIVHRPGVVGGDATINGTRIAVWHLVVAARYTPAMDDLLTDYPSLTPELIQEAFAYYAAYSDEINQAIAENHDVLIAEERAMMEEYEASLASKSA